MALWKSPLLNKQTNQQTLQIENQWKFVLMPFDCHYHYLIINNNPEPKQRNSCQIHLSFVSRQ